MTSKSRVLTLPDASRVRLDHSSLRFTHVGETEVQVGPSDGKESRTRSEPIDSGVWADPVWIAQRLEFPSTSFSDSFWRRISDVPSYGTKSCGPDVTALPGVYEFPGFHQGGVFSSTHLEWHFLDGGIIRHDGYGFGSHSGSCVYGAEVVRVNCLFFGIIQPRRMKGEATRRPLSRLLEELSAADLTDSARRILENPATHSS